MERKQNGRLIAIATGLAIGISSLGPGLAQGIAAKAALKCSSAETSSDIRYP